MFGHSMIDGSAHPRLRKEEELRPTILPDIVPHLSQPILHVFLAFQSSARVNTVAEFYTDLVLFWVDVDLGDASAGVARGQPKSVVESLRATVTFVCHPEQSSQSLNVNISFAWHAEAFVEGIAVHIGTEVLDRFKADAVDTADVGDGISQVLRREQTVVCRTVFDHIPCQDAVGLCFRTETLGEVMQVRARDEDKLLDNAERHARGTGG